MTQIRRGREPVVDDRPMMTAHPDGVRLELGHLTSPWVIELTHAECEQIAEAIGWRQNQHYPPSRGSDS
jgi:hypothetical protein